MMEKPPYRELEKEIRTLRRMVSGNEYLKRVFHSISQPLIILDLDQTILSANLAAEKLSGLKQNDLVGKKCFHIFHNPKAESPPESCVFKSVISDNKARSIEIENKLLNRTYLISLSPVFDEYNKLVRVVHMSTDVSKWKQAEDALRKSQDELEQCVRERIGELELKNEQVAELKAALNVLLEKREEDKKLLAQNVMQNVHDLIQPMIDSLKSSGLKNHQQGYLETLESFLKEIANPFTGNLKAQYRLLTPTEVRVANMIRQGKSTKEIAQLLHLSATTIKHHRSGIRKKLGITNQKVNLARHLASIPE